MYAISISLQSLLGCAGFVGVGVMLVLNGLSSHPGSKGFLSSPPIPKWQARVFHVPIGLIAIGTGLYYFVKELLQD